MCLTKTPTLTYDRTVLNTLQWILQVEKFFLDVIVDTLVL